MGSRIPGITVDFKLAISIQTDFPSCAKNRLRLSIVEERGVLGFEEKNRVGRDSMGVQSHSWREFAGATKAEATMSAQHTATMHSQEDKIAYGLLRARDARAHGIDLIGPELIQAIYRCLLGRDAETDAIAHYHSLLHEQYGIEHVIRIIQESDEYRRRSSQVQSGQAHPAGSFENPVFAFIHIQKTGGTSLQNMLIKVFEDGEIYREHDDTLYLRSPSELSHYKAYIGHFNYDSIRYIPKANVSLATFFRVPAERLASLYRFWRAHDAEHPSFHRGMELANSLEFPAFLEQLTRERTADTWNHMTWAIMGDRYWTDCAERLDKAPDEVAGFSVFKDKFREDVKGRLSEFAFVGMLHDFSRSVERLSSLIGGGTLSARHDHATEALSGTEPFFKLAEPVGVLSSDTDALIKLTQLDNVLFEEALRIYETSVA